MSLSSEVGARRSWGHCGGVDLPERLLVERLLSDERRVVHAEPRSKLSTLPWQPERCRTSRPNQWQPTSERWVSTAGRAGTLRPIAYLCSQREFRRRKRARAICRPIRRPVVSAAALEDAAARPRSSVRIGRRVDRTLPSRCQPCAGAVSFALRCDAEHLACEKRLRSAARRNSASIVYRLPLQSCVRFSP
jgi:hypothetical protein